MSACENKSLSVAELTGSIIDDDFPDEEVAADYTEYGWDGSPEELVMFILVEGL